MIGVGARVEVGVRSGHGATGAGVATPGAAPRRSFSATMRSRSAREASSSTVNCMPMPGATGGCAAGLSAWIQRTMPWPRTAASPPASLSSRCERRADRLRVAGADEDAAARDVHREALDELVDDPYERRTGRPTGIRSAPRLSWGPSTAGIIASERASGKRAGVWAACGRSAAAAERGAAPGKP